MLFFTDVKRADILNHYFFQYQKDVHLFPMPSLSSVFLDISYVYYINTLIERKNKPIFSPVFEYC